jgi:ATP/maltotriose-dependent transcriptional regulator MalT
MQTTTSLSQRELEILRFVASGAKNRQIADALALSAHTVKRHLARIFSKLKVRSRREAAAIYRHSLDDFDFRPWSAPVDSNVSGLPAFRLTDREIQVLAEIAKGSSSQQIAGELLISCHTVKRHTANIFGKLGVQNRSHAAAVVHAATSMAHTA